MLSQSATVSDTVEERALHALFRILPWNFTSNMFRDVCNFMVIYCALLSIFILCESFSFLRFLTVVFLLSSAARILHFFSVTYCLFVTGLSTSLKICSVFLF